MTVVYQYPRCSTCRKALKWLESNGISVKSVDIVKDTPDASTLQRAIERSELPLRRFFNTSGKVYREGNYKDKVGDMSVQDAATALSENGMLIRRPLVIHDDFVLVGFKEDAWAEAFGTA